MEKYALLFDSVFKKDTAAPGNADFLEKVTAAYPYFSTAHFYLLQSLQKTNPGYKKQVRKTAVIFNNNYWLNFQLLEAGRLHTSTVDQQTFSIEGDNNLSTSDNSSIDTDHSVEEVNPEHAIQPPIETEAAAVEEIIDDNTEIPVQAKPYPDELAVPEESKEEIAGETETPAIETDKTHEEIIPEFPIEVKEDTTDLSLTKPVDESASRPGDAPGELLFEPLHTTDYFASVGIKLNEEARPTDRLGKQLKSFTEWLKTMKKMHPEQVSSSVPADQQPDTTETKIQQLAERSNIEDEVVTEAMADVLLRQGNKNKAVALLEKLSLLNPSKSAYFAAKIKQVKES